MSWEVEAWYTLRLGAVDEKASDLTLDKALSLIRELSEKGFKIITLTE